MFRSHCRLLLAALAAAALGAGAGAEESRFRAEAAGAHAGQERGSIVITLEGRATHLGDFSGTLLVSGGTFKKRGAMTLANAAADSLNLDFEVADPDRDGVFAGTYTVTGGTGRFERASGTGSMAVLLGEPLFLTLDGRLSL